MKTLALSFSWPGTSSQTLAQGKQLNYILVFAWPNYCLSKQLCMNKESPRRPCIQVMTHELRHQQLLTYQSSSPLPLLVIRQLPNIAYNLVLASFPLPLCSPTLLLSNTICFHFSFFVTPCSIRCISVDIFNKISC